MAKPMFNHEFVSHYLSPFFNPANHDTTMANHESLSLAPLRRSGACTSDLDLLGFAVSGSLGAAPLPR